jgi:hypothetical protein
MLRESLAPESAYAAMGFRSWTNTANFCYRTSTLGPVGCTGSSTGNWYKLVRSGNTFTGYASADGSTWVQQGSQTISMASTIYVGFAVTSTDTSHVTTATFDNVTITSP